MRSWEQIISGAVDQLEEEGLSVERTGDVLHTNFCTIEFSGTPWKPEYWVNEVRCRAEEFISAVENAEKGEDI